jgi:hypothetical protein
MVIEAAKRTPFALGRHTVHEGKGLTTLLSPREVHYCGDYWSWHSALLFWRENAGLTTCYRTLQLKERGKSDAKNISNNNQLLLVWYFYPFRISKERLNRDIHNYLEDGKVFIAKIT